MCGLSIEPFLRRHDMRFQFHREITQLPLKEKFGATGL